MEHEEKRKKKELPGISIFKVEDRRKNPRNKD